ncbi:MAG: ribulose-phosphate 3-epimerase [bacterium]
MSEGNQKRDSKVKISASLLSADFARLEEVIGSISQKVDFIHCDVMDGHFVPNLTFGPLLVKTIKRISPVPLDVHLMITEPSKWIEKYLQCGLTQGDYLIFHIEAERHPWEALKAIRRSGVGVGLSLKPATPLDEVISWKSDIDMLLIMSVEPGFGGQDFLYEVVPKIYQAQKSFPASVIMAVDGGVNKETAPLVREAGANLLVVGNAIFSQPDPLLAVDDIRNAAELVKCPKNL